MNPHSPKTGPRQLPKTVVVAAAVAALAGVGVPQAGQAAGLEPVVSRFVSELPCQPDPGLFLVTLTSRDGFHERISGGYHENSVSIGEFAAGPVDLIGEDDGAPVVAARDGETYTGRAVFTHTANDGDQGPGHAVSSVGTRIEGTGDAGTRVAFHAMAHITATARPYEDPSAVIRVYVEKASCR